MMINQIITAIAAASVIAVFLQIASDTIDRWAEVTAEAEIVTPYQDGHR